MQGPGLFTKNGHFIVLSSADANGRIMVRDPNKNNAINKGYKDRLFTSKEIDEAAKRYFIFRRKNVQPPQNSGTSGNTGISGSTGGTFTKQWKKVNGVDIRGTFYSNITKKTFTIFDQTEGKNNNYLLE